MTAGPGPAAATAADINREADEFEAELRRSREELEVRREGGREGGRGRGELHTVDVNNAAQRPPPSFLPCPLTARLASYGSEPALLFFCSTLPPPSPPPRLSPCPSVQAAEREQEEWESDVAVARSQGQFFQTLYQTSGKRPVGMSSQQLQKVRVG